MAIKLDKRNSRRHTDGNKRAIRKSLEGVKAARSIVLDSGDNVLAGNGVAEQWEAMGGKIRIVESNGDELIAVKRTDVAPDSPEALQIAIADNIVSDTSAGQYDLDILKAAMDSDAFIAGLALDNSDSLAALNADAGLAALVYPHTTPPTLDELSSKYGEPDPDDFNPVIRVRVTSETKELFDSLMAQVAGKDDGEKLGKLLSAVNVAALSSVGLQ